MLTAAQLFTPAPSGVGAFGNVPQVPASGTWLGVMLNIATTVQLPTTAWQSGGPERTILASQAVTFAQSDVVISVMAQGGFLSTAASGSVTYTASNGTVITVPVTPDPSNAAQNPTGAPGWLDTLSGSVYGVTRLQATYATGSLAIVNVKVPSVGPYAAGAYHVAQPGNGATYHNTASLTVPSSVIAGTGGVVTGVAPGLTSTIVTTQTAHGLSVGQTVYLLVPLSSGVSGLAGVFAIVASVTSTTFQVPIGSSGSWTAGGNVYLCTVATMVADVAGTSSNAPPGSVTTAVTQNAGISVSNVTGWSGSNWESNATLAARTVLSLAIRSPNGPSQAYVYYASTAQQILSSGVLPGNGGSWPVYALTNGPVLAYSYATPATGVVTTVVASASPASTTYGANVTPGVSQLPISGVSNANPCVITCSGATGLSPAGSETVTISGVLGTAGVNGTFVGTYVGANSFSIPIDTTLTGTYTGGGSVEGGDLGQIDALLQANVVPDGVVAQTVSALAWPITIVASVAVPLAYVAAYGLAVRGQIVAQLASYGIGGSAPGFALAYADIVGALEEAGVLVLGGASYVRQVTSLTITANVTTVPVGGSVLFPGPNYQAILASVTVGVVGV